MYTFTAQYPFFHFMEAKYSSQSKSVFKAFSKL